MFQVNGIYYVNRRTRQIKHPDLSNENRSVKYIFSIKPM